MKDKLKTLERGLLSYLCPSVSSVPRLPPSPRSAPLPPQTRSGIREPSRRAPPTPIHHVTLQRSHHQRPQPTQRRLGVLEQAPAQHHVLEKRLRHLGQLFPPYAAAPQVSVHRGPVALGQRREQRIMPRPRPRRAAPPPASTASLETSPRCVQGPCLTPPPPGGGSGVSRGGGTPHAPDPESAPENPLPHGRGSDMPDATSPAPSGGGVTSLRVTEEASSSPLAPSRALPDPTRGFADSSSASQDSSPKTHTQLVSLLAKIRDAVQLLHEYGVIHRDLKPSNIIIDQRRRAGGSRAAGGVAESGEVGGAEAGGGDAFSDITAVLANFNASCP